MTTPPQRLVFPAAIEGLLKGLGDQVTPEWLAQLPPAMPVELRATHMDFIRARVFPELEREEGLRRIGRAFIDG